MKTLINNWINKYIKGKYLTINDITSLGFKETAESIDYGKYIKFKSNFYWTTKTYAYTNEYPFDTGFTLTFSTYLTNENLSGINVIIRKLNSTIFEGRINNKKEFKIILKALYIL
jgi:hypothetical protein